MKKLLPHKSSGFTLIELLVVIAIIAVLATIGFAVYNGVTTRGNDAKRQADIKAIADVFEVKRTGGNYGGLTIAAADFSAGAIPADPVAAKAYCMATTTGTTPPANASISLTDGIDGTGCHGGTYVAVGTLPANTTFFKICAANQANAAPTLCVGSKQ